MTSKRSLAPFLAVLFVATLASAQTAPATTQSAIPADQSTPRGALRVLGVALDAGDAATIRAVFQISNPEEQKMVDALVRYREAVAKFGKAAAQAFGENEAKKLTGDPAAAQAAALQALQAMPEE